MIIYRQDLMPDMMFRDLSGDEIVEFTNWANNPENQTEENYRKVGLFHPVVRAVWEKTGLITIVDKSTDS